MAERKHYPYQPASIFLENNRISESVDGDPVGMEFAKTLARYVPVERAGDVRAWSKAEEKLDNKFDRGKHVPQDVRTYAQALERGALEAAQVSDFVDKSVLPDDKSQGARVARLVAKGKIYNAVKIKGIDLAAYLAKKPEDNQEGEDNQNPEDAMRAFVEEAQSAYPSEKVYVREGKRYSASSDDPGTRVIAYLLTEKLPGRFAEPTLAETTAYNLKNAPVIGAAVRRFGSIS